MPAYTLPVLPMDITVFKPTISEAVRTQIVDIDFNEEYILHRISDAADSFVGAIKATHERELLLISQQCFDPDVFQSHYAKKVIAYVRGTYGDDLEYN